MQFLNNKIFKVSIFVIFIVMLIYMRYMVLINSETPLNLSDLHLGTAAKELFEGLHWPLIYYQANAYEGGTIIAALITSFVFKIFGVSIVSIKLTTLFNTIVIFTVLFLFLWRFYNKSTLIFSSLLFIFCWPSFTKLGLLNWGNHFESLFFSIIYLYIFFTIFLKDRKSLKYFSLLGFITGLSIWYAQIFLLTFFSSLIYLFLVKQKISLKSFLFASVFFVVGFSPWLYFNFLHDFSGIHEMIHIGARVTPSVIGIISKFILFFIRDIPASFCFSKIGGIYGQVWGLFYALIFFISYLGMIAQLKNDHQKKSTLNEHSANLYYLIYVVLYATFFCLGSFVLNPSDTPSRAYQGFRYLSPLHLHMILIIGIFIGKIFNETKLKKKRIFILVLICSLGGIGLKENLRLADGHNLLADQARTDYYSYWRLGYNLGRKFPPTVTNLKDNIKLIKKLDKVYWRKTFEGYGSCLGGKLDKNMDEINEILSEAKAILPEECFYSFSIGFVSGTLNETKYKMKALPEKYITKIQDLQVRRIFYSMMGAYVYLRGENTHCFLEKKYCQIFYEGVGAGVFIKDWHAIRREEVDVNMFLKDILPEEYLYDAYLGFGEILGYRSYTHNASWQEILKISSNIDALYKKSFYTGLAGAILEKSSWEKSFYDLPATLEYFQQNEKQFVPSFYIGLGRYWGKVFSSKERRSDLLNTVQNKNYQDFCIQGFEFYDD